MQFCLGLRKLFSTNRKNTRGTKGNVTFLCFFHLRCSMNMGLGIIFFHFRCILNMGPEFFSHLRCIMTMGPGMCFRFAEDLVVCSALGCDMYDCVFPTRTAVGHHTLLACLPAMNSLPNNCIRKMWKDCLHISFYLIFPINFLKLYAFSIRPLLKLSLYPHS